MADDVRDKLQSLARDLGRSVEEQVRSILRTAVDEAPGKEAGLGTRIARRFAGIGLEQDIPGLRGHLAGPAKFEP